VSHRARHWTVRVDGLACGGSGLCLGIAPDHFESGPDHRARLRTAHLAGDDPGLDQVRDAVACCPMEAITLTPPDGGTAPG
jgi:ferredoxin